MPCRLCLEDKPLSNSHIIPEFFYYEIYEQPARNIFVLDLENKKFSKTIQKGHREKLLCYKCENIISKYEGEFKNRIYGEGKNVLDTKNWKYEIEHNRKFLIMNKNLSFFSLRYLQLSILWRASFSQHGMFADVNLGKYKEILRQMLLNEHLDDDRIICYMRAVNLNGKPLLDGMTNFAQFRGNRTHYFYNAIFGGFDWNYIVSGTPLDAKLKEGLEIQMNTNRLLVYEFQDIPRSKEIIKFVTLLSGLAF